MKNQQMQLTCPTSWRLHCAVRTDCVSSARADFLPGYQYYIRLKNWLHPSTSYNPLLRRKSEIVYILHRKFPVLLGCRL